MLLKSFCGLIVNMNFGKLFYVAVHLSIVWTYIKYYELRELFLMVS